ncbi:MULTISPECIES: LLM class flavin-dependent oxidoreductase [unclassified Rhodococcus (in: high G+C Gram-positive bacteria)]|uniref:LLM class flavin-dependent oxidoreductase n=1 Tax=unclassified Rhodococcus (in: high G+C Gram-positive bacteria) TaxID=192944 RepID=UPI001FFC2101|nr:MULTISPECIES: LLM class flavin-dependent oxidoreductase [unclassified Rhodococcus (in: high G+C Gram-positive bacteria)]
MRDLATAADAGSWESLWVYDHFHTVSEPTEEATHEPWTLMSAIAASTSRIRHGQMCTAMAYRNLPTWPRSPPPSIPISGGRVEMGIGAGWYEQDWRAYGYGFPPPRERLGRLDESVQILRQAWTTGSVTRTSTAT